MSTEEGVIEGHWEARNEERRQTILEQEEEEEKEEDEEEEACNQSRNYGLMNRNLCLEILNFPSRSIALCNGFCPLFRTEYKSFSKGLSSNMEIEYFTKSAPQFILIYVKSQNIASGILKLTYIKTKN